MEEQLEEGQIVLCTVDKIVGTTVFVKIEGNSERFHFEKNNKDNNKMESQVEGTITTSEISPGRIRNLRDYVVPGKKIVCKILSIKGDKIYLSLRRVKQNEKKELLDKIKKEKSYKAILSIVLGKEKAKKIKEKIIQEHSISDFFKELKTNPELINNYLNKTEGEKIIKILESKKEKPKEIKRIFRLSNNSSNGISVVKDILQNSCKNTSCNILYLAAGKYKLSIIGSDFKQIKTEVNKVMNNIEKSAKKKACDFSLEKS